MNYVELFKKAVKENCEEIAVVDLDGRRSTTYAELDKTSGRIAAKLAANGCIAGSKAVICLGRRMEYIAAYIGVLKAGCVVVPVVPDYPRERIEYIYSDAEAKIIIDDAFLKDLDSYTPSEPVILDDFSPVCLSIPRVRPEDQKAYFIMYTPWLVRLYATKNSLRALISLSWRLRRQ